MGIEVSPELGGAGMKFMSAILTIEALATVDPSVSVMVDVQVQPKKVNQFDSLEYFSRNPSPKMGF